MMDGLTASSRFVLTVSQPASPAAAPKAAAVNATRPRFIKSLIIVWSELLEAEVETELEHRGLRERLELARGIATARRREIALGIGSAVVRPELDVARREHEARPLMRPHPP